MNSEKVISGGAVIHNLEWCKGKSAGKEIMAMVKADGYGHGMEQIVTLLKDKVKWFGVANADEAIKLKNFLEKRHTILVVGKTCEYDLLIKNGIHITIDCEDKLIKVIKTAKNVNKQAYVHLAINTGMNRIGVKDLKTFKKMVKIIRNNNCICLAGVFTHMFDADQKKGHFDEQIKLFSKFVEIVKDKNILVHIGGSFCLQHKMPKFVNMVRVGYFLYGYGEKNLLPVMSIESYVTKLTNCKKGEFVGYGDTRLKKDTMVAVVPLGYSDGVCRRLSEKAYVLINGVSCKIVGKVCMDCFMVESTNANAKVGDGVVVFNDAEQWAQIVQTSPYEILTRFSSSRTKIVILDGE